MRFLAMVPGFVGFPAASHIPGERVCRGAPPRNSLNFRMIGELQTVRDSPVAFSSEEPGHTPQAPRPERSESSILKTDQHLSLVGVCTPQGSAYCLKLENRGRRHAPLERRDKKLRSGEEPRHYC